MIYLDNSATTVVREEVRDAMLPYLGEHGGNPSSIHKSGRLARQAVDRAREQVALLLNCKPSEIFFTPCGTYSNNTAILGRARYAEANGMGRHLITCQIEHPSVLGPAKYLEANNWDVTYLPVDAEGLIDLAVLQRNIKPNTSIVSLMWANNEIGSVFPIAEFAAAVRERGAFFHTDAVQVPGKMRIDVQELGVDTLALSGHKFYAPKGIGILYKRETVQVQPIVWGGGQEGALFPGTEALSSIVGIGVAAELAYKELDREHQHLKEMGSVLLEGLRSIEGARLTGPKDPDKRLPGHASAVLPGVEGEAAVLQCDLKSLMISSASACKKGIMQPSHVVAALGIADEVAVGSLRLSAGRFNTIDECQTAIATVGNVVAKLRKSAGVTA